MDERNKVTLVGTVADDLMELEPINEERFYSFTIAVQRNSGAIDSLPVIISERILKGMEISGKRIAIDGEFRSHNYESDGAHHLTLYVFAHGICAATGEDINSVVLNGYICKKPTHRMTPLGREVSDVILAVNRQYGRSDYIPCIFWGRSAQYLAEQEVSTNIRVIGRIQSRHYNKKNTTRTAYEVSVQEFKCYT